MEENDILQKYGIAIVECPYCKQSIEAPNKMGVVFKCPVCHRELITYNIEKNTQTLKKQQSMSLVYCKECGKQISSNAPACPYCGCPQTVFSKSDDIHLGYLFISFLIPLVGLILIFALSGNENRGKLKSAGIGTCVGLISSIIIWAAFWSY